MAAAAGVSHARMLDMDTIELAIEIRGYEVRKLDMQYFLRWMTAALLSPHSKTAVDPSKLISLGNEVIKASSERKDKISKLKQMRDADKAAQNN